MTGGVTRQLAELLGPVLAALSLDVEDVEIVPAGSRRIIRVVVDRDGGVGVDDLADATRLLGPVLDDTAEGARPYTLEVASPGVDRALRLPRHWRRNTGRLVRVVRRGGGELQGRVLAADDEAVSLDVDGTVRRLGYDEVATARVQVEFRRPAEPVPADADPRPDDSEEG